MSIQRRAFLGLAGTGLAAAASPLSGLTSAHAREASEPGGLAPGIPLAPAERDYMTSGDGMSVLDSAMASAMRANWDMTWVDRVTGKHRAVFDSPGVSEGAAMFRAVMWCNQYKEIYGTPRTDMSPVVVLRHSGIVLAMNQEFWDRYDAPKEFKIETEEGKAIRKNPVAGPTDGTAGVPYSIPAFINGGGIVLACALAFRDMVGTVRKKDKLSGEEADKAARAMLVPGVILMPSGIFAAGRAQEAGCQYILGS